jgi:hypothetical protein
MASKIHFLFVFGLGTGVFFLAQKSLIPEWVGFGALLVLTLVIRVMLSNSAPKEE